VQSLLRQRLPFADTAQHKGFCARQKSYAPCGSKGDVGGGSYQSREVAMATHVEKDLLWNLHQRRGSLKKPILCGAAAAPFLFLFMCAKPK